MLIHKENDARVGFANALLIMVIAFAIGSATWVWALEPALEQADKDYKLRMQCVQEHIEYGIPRNRIVETPRGCYVAKLY